MVTATIVRHWRRPLSAVALRRVAEEESYCVIVITPTHVEAHIPARCITAAALFGGAPPAYGRKRRAGPDAAADRSGAVGGQDERERRDGVALPVRPVPGRCVGSLCRHGRGAAPPADAPAPGAAAVVARSDPRRDRVRGAATVDAVIRRVVEIGGSGGRAIR